MNGTDRFIAGILGLGLLVTSGCLRGEVRQAKVAFASVEPVTVAGLRPGESTRVTDDVFPGAEDVDEETTVWAWHIVDLETGEPLPDAIVQAPNHESGAPEDLYFLGEAKADEDGWVRLRQDQVEGFRDYIVADAPGYAPDENCLPGRTLVELRRGTDVPIVLYDFVGRPVPNAIVGYNLGCGHIPDQRTARTDAHGRAVLPAIWPERHNDLFVVSESLHNSCSDLSRTWQPGQPPVPIHSSPGHVLEGRVIARDGGPAVGAFIGSNRYQRPAAVTDSQGRFRLVGLARWDGLFASLPPFDDEPPKDVDPKEYFGDRLFDFTAPPPGTPIVLVQGEPRSGIALDVRCIGRSGEPAKNVRVVACRDRDACTITEHTNERGVAELSVPAGRYRILVDGELGAWGEAEVPFVVEGDERHELTIEIPKNPIVRVDSSRLPEHVNVRLATPTRFLRLEFDEPITDVPVPTSERAVFRLSGSKDPQSTDDGVRYFEIPSISTDAAAAREPILLEWLPTTRIRASFAGPEREPIVACLDLAGAEIWHDVCETSVVRETCLDGEVHWTATPDDPSLDPLSGIVHLPTGGGDVDLGTIRFLRAPLRELTVLLPPEMGPGSVGVTHGEFDGDVFEADSDRLVVTQPWFDDGVLVELDAYDFEWLPFRFELEGSAPWEVEWPTATIDLAVRDANDEPLAKASILLDHRPIYQDHDDGHYRLAGISAGPHRLVVAADYHKSVIMDVIVEDAEFRQIEVTLERREQRE